MRRFLVIGLVTSSIPFLGCTSKSGSNQLQPTTGPALSNSSATDPFHDPRYGKLVRQIEDNGGSSAWPDKPQSATQKIGSAVKKASASVAGALTLKPKVDPAPDPILLSSMPDQINVDVYYQAGRLAESSGNRDVAIKQYKHALQEDAQHVPSLISLARLYDRQGNFEEAERLYRQAIKAEPENAMAYNDLGLCLARSDRAEASVATLRQAARLEPKRKLYRNNLATVLVDMGRCDEAWNELNNVYSPAESHYNVGYLLFQKGKQDDARQRFNLACKADKSLTTAREMLAQMDGNTNASDPTPDAVRYRVDDFQAAAPRVASGGAVRATPVALVRSPLQLRRTPPTDGTTACPDSQPPAIRLQQPVPLTAPAEPATAPLNRSGMHVPSPTTFGSVVGGTDEQDLPTPQLLQEIAQNVN